MSKNKIKEFLNEKKRVIKTSVIIVTMVVPTVILGLYAVDHSKKLINELENIEIDNSNDEIQIEEA